MIVGGPQYVGGLVITSSPTYNQPSHVFTHQTSSATLGGYGGLRESGVVDERSDVAPDMPDGVRVTVRGAPVSSSAAFMIEVAVVGSCVGEPTEPDLLSSTRKRA